MSTGPLKVIEAKPLKLGETAAEAPEASSGCVTIASLAPSFENRRMSSGSARSFGRPDNTTRSARAWPSSRRTGAAAPSSPVAVASAGSTVRGRSNVKHPRSRLPVLGVQSSSTSWASKTWGPLLESAAAAQQKATSSSVARRSWPQSACRTRTSAPRKGLKFSSGAASASVLAPSPFTTIVPSLSPGPAGRVTVPRRRRIRRARTACG
mmetsp:Transcript_21715/g.68603  ORF Transcript_21715/g.68603 Transcript_21715/m.68603 type:complete len:209 (-) Transcript_21715:384-1010(-)